MLSGKHVNDDHLHSQATIKIETDVKRKLQINYKYLQDNLEPHFLMGYFIQEGLSTTDESDEIMETQPKTRFTRATKFIHMVMRLCPGSYAVFRSALLKENLSFIVKTLDETTVPQRQSINTGMLLLIHLISAHVKITFLKST